ncbi:hypothetical protein PG994_001464 [Apiospora phragmitis]|uniref:Uncharacterized protein n=1 Tax=Apiospora phragmitis TaxID=2905665 RepID=A0ABR1WTK6_9PEZI
MAPILLYALQGLTKNNTANAITTPSVFPDPLHPNSPMPPLFSSPPQPEDNNSTSTSDHMFDISNTLAFSILSYVCVCHTGAALIVCYWNQNMHPYPRPRTFVPQWLGCFVLLPLHAAGRPRPVGAGSSSSRHSCTGATLAVGLPALSLYVRLFLPLPL